MKPDPFRHRALGLLTREGASAAAAMPGRCIRRPSRGPDRGVHVVVTAGFHVLRRGTVTRLVPFLVGDLFVVLRPRGSVPFIAGVILSVAGVLLALRDRQAAVVVVVVEPG